MASLVIAVLLGYIAVVLGRDTKELLIGEAADPVVLATACAVISSYPEIVAVKDILTMQLGPSAVLLAARVQFDDDLRAVEVELIASDIEDTLRERLPDIVQCSSTRPGSPPRTSSRLGSTSATTLPTSPR